MLYTIEYNTIQIYNVVYNRNVYAICKLSSTFRAIETVLAFKTLLKQYKFNFTSKYLYCSEYKHMKA